MPIHIPFEDFVASAGPEHTKFIANIHSYLQENNCIAKIKTAASGYVVSYIHKPTNKTVLNYIFRKKMPLMRLYADNVNEYEALVNSLPVSMKNTIRAGGDCKRLTDPTACNSKCRMGFNFMLDEERQRKCRCHNSFAFFLNDETKPHLFELMKQELQARIHNT